MREPRRQPGDPDAFDLLGIEPRFDLDEAAVQRAWLRAAARSHPDRAADADDAVGLTARLNQAREILIDPERRAEALLARSGGDGGEGGAAPGLTDPAAAGALPEGFLVEIFSVREALNEAQEAGDAAGIAAFEAWADQRRRGYIRRITELFGSSPGPATATRDAEIRRTLNAWRYIERMLEQIGPGPDAM